MGNGGGAAAHRRSEIEKLAMMRPLVLTTPTPLMPFSAISASATTAGVSGVTDTTLCAAQPSACTVVSASAPSR